MMGSTKAMRLKRGLLACLVVGAASLAVPTLVDAGGVHLSIGIGIPVPVYVAPAPVVVYPAPRLVYPPPVVIADPYMVYGHHHYKHHKHSHFPPGLAKMYYGHHQVYGYKNYKHHRHHRKHHHDD